MNPVCALAKADPTYQAALAQAGFSTGSVLTYGGKQYTHDDIADICEAAYARHRGEYLEDDSDRPKVAKRKRRQFERVCNQDVRSSFGISWMTILSGIFLFALMGPIGLVVAVLSAYFQWRFEKDLNGDQAVAMAAMGAA